MVAEVLKGRDIGEKDSFLRLSRLKSKTVSAFLFYSDYYVPRRHVSGPACPTGTPLLTVSSVGLVLLTWPVIDTSCADLETFIATSHHVIFVITCMHHSTTYYTRS